MTVVSVIVAGCWRRAQRRGASEVSTTDVLGLASALSASRASRAADSLVRMAAAKWLHDATGGSSGSSGSSIPLQNLLTEMQNAQSESAELALMALAALPEDPQQCSKALLFWVPHIGVMCM